MHIAFFGSSLLSAYWNGAATYYRGLIRALADLGHTIVFYEPDAFERQQHKDMEEPSWCRSVVYTSKSTTGVYQALEEARREADCIVKASGVGVFDDLLEVEIPIGRKHGQAILFWDVDAPATLDRMAANLSDSFRPLVPKYDLVLTYGGGTPVVDAYKSFGAQNCVPIYNALDTSTHHPVEKDARFSASLGFLGNRLPDRERRVEQFFLEPAASLPDRTFLLGGNGWHDKTMSPNVRYAGHVYTGDHNAFNCTPQAVLNISRESMARYGFSPATRVFEAAGAGACLITDEWEGIELFLQPDEEVLVAPSGDSVVEHLQSLTPEKARRIGQAAYRRVIAEHTYTHRAVQVDSILSGRCSAAAR